MAWKVVLYCSDRASICSHALILLSQTRWIVMTGWRTRISIQPVFKHVWIVVPCLGTSICLLLLGQTRLDFGSLLCTSISLHPCLKHVLIMVPCLRTHQSPALCFECVWIVDPCLCTRIRLQPCSNTFDYGCLFVYWHLCLEPKWQRKCWVFRGVRMVMGTSTVA